MFGALVQMALPTPVLLDIPSPLWVPLGFAIVALVERIATMSVRIARKHEQELLRRAIARKQIQLVIEGRADGLLLISLPENGLRRGSPSEVGFNNTDDPDDKPEEAANSALTSHPRR